MSVLFPVAPGVTMPATGVNVVSSTTITAFSPAGAAGTGDVRVVNTLGESAVAAADQFTYQVPNQTIVFPPPVTPAFAGTAALLGATASSGLAVTYTVVSGPATVSGNVVTYLAAGTVVLQADQAGDGSSNTAAAPVQQTVTVQLLSEPIGTQSPVVTTVVGFSTMGTLGTAGVYLQGAVGLDFSLAAGGDCAVGTTYAVGQTCTVAFTFKPTRPGLRFGGISLTSPTGVLLGNTYISGLGVGPQVVFTPATQSVVGASLNAAPSGVAVDGLGNLYMSDYGGTVGVGEVLVGGGVRKFGNLGSTDDVTVDGSGNVFVCTRTQVYELMAVNGAMPANPTIRQIAASQVGVAFNSLNGMKVDRNGNVFLANSNTTADNSTILELLAVNGAMPDEPVVRTLVTGIGEPTGVALDVNGNVFVSDEVGAVEEITAVNGVIPDNPVVRKITAAGLGEPTNIAVDAIGDIYVSDYTTGFLEELLAVNGSVPTTGATLLTVGTGLTEGQGITLDPSGVIYVAVDTIPGPVKLDYTLAPTLNFASTIVGQTSSDSPQKVTLQNSGNADLVFTGTNPQISVGFGLAGGSSCPQSVSGGTAGTLGPGAVCSELVNFTPTFVGNNHGTLVITDDYLNSTGATQTVILNGTGLPIPPQLLFTVPNHFVDDAPFTVMATSNSPAPITYTYVSGPATLAGNVVTLTGVVGTVVLQASQAAQGLYDSATVTATFQVTKHPQTILFTQPQSPARLGFGPITLQASASSGLPVVFTVLSGPGNLSGNQLTLNAAGTIVVAADQPGNAVYDAAPEVTRTIIVIDPTVMMTLTAAPNLVFVKNPVLFTATLSYAGGVANSAVQFFEGLTLLGTGQLVNGTVATLTTSSLAVGLHHIYAVYPGDTLFSPATSNTVDVLVEDFSLVIHNPDVTISHGGTAVYNLTVTTVGGTGMASAIGFTLGGGPPDHSPATFNPGSVPTGSGTTDFTLTIATPDYPVGPFAQARSTGDSLALAFGGAGILFALFGKRRARRLAAVIVLLAGIGLSGCVQQWGTQRYSISVTATSGALSHTVQATLTSK
jgi:hypothetical protein